MWCRSKSAGGWKVVTWAAFRTRAASGWWALFGSGRDAVIDRRRSEATAYDELDGEFARIYPDGGKLSTNYTARGLAYASEMEPPIGPVLLVVDSVTYNAAGQPVREVLGGQSLVLGDERRNVPLCTPGLP